MSQQNPPQGPGGQPPQGPGGPPPGGPPPGGAPPPQQPAGPPQPYSGGGQPYPQYQGQNVYRTGPSGPRADFGRRLGAFLIDGLILYIPLTIIFFVLVLAVDATSDTTTDAEATGLGIGFLFTWLLFLILPWVYFIFLEGGPTGQTIGKRALGIRVVDMQTGGPIGYGKSTLRTIIRSFISGLLCGLGYLWMLWDPEKQTWHDKLSNSVVVPVSSYPVVR